MACPEYSAGPNPVTRTTEDEHSRNLESTVRLERLKDNGLRVRQNKGEFLKPFVDYRVSHCRPGITRAPTKRSGPSQRLQRNKIISYLTIFLSSACLAIMVHILLTWHPWLRKITWCSLNKPECNDAETVWASSLSGLLSDVTLVTFESNITRNWGSCSGSSSSTSRFSFYTAGPLYSTSEITVCTQHTQPLFSVRLHCSPSDADTNKA